MKIIFFVIYSYLLRLKPSLGNIRKKGVHVGRVPHMHTFFAESLAQAEQLHIFYR